MKSTIQYKALITDLFLLDVHESCVAYDVFFA